MNPHGTDPTSSPTGQFGGQSTRQRTTTNARNHAGFSPIDRSHPRRRIEHVLNRLGVEWASNVVDDRRRKTSRGPATSGTPVWANTQSIAVADLLHEGVVEREHVCRGAAEQPGQVIGCLTGD